MENLKSENTIGLSDKVQTTTAWTKNCTLLQSINNFLGGKKMKKLYLIICVICLTLILSDIAKATIPVVWQANPDGSGVVTNNNSISRVKLTPDKNNVMVFHYNGGASGIPTRVDKLNASSGNFVWPLPGYKTVTKPGERISLNGWVDGSGNLFIMGSWSGYTIWKYDSELDTELCSYTGGSGFEYVKDAINDELGNLYVAGMTGSGSNQGSRLVKLDDNCNEIWTCLSKNTSQKDDYGRGIALDSSKNVFRVGSDSCAAYPSYRGRLIGHNTSDGAEFLNYTVNETNSIISGITIDSDDYLYIAYCYGYTPSGQERTVVQKLERVGSTANVVWEYRFEDIGMYLGGEHGGDAIVKHTTNSFYVALNLRQGGTTVPGIAEFDLDGNLLWKDTIDRPGWNLSSIDAKDNYIYVGLTNKADGSQTQVLCLRKPVTGTEPLLAVEVDIKPGSCPNSLNVKSKGVLPVAILGSADFDVFNIDPASIRLEGAAPVRSSYEDVATPVSNKTDDCDCTTEGPDGYLDLVLKFDTQEIVAALGGVYDGDVYLLTLTGEDLSGTPIEGTDCVVIIAKGGK